MRVFLADFFGINPSLWWIIVSLGPQDSGSIKNYYTDTYTSYERALRNHCENSQALFQFISKMRVHNWLHNLPIHDECQTRSAMVWALQGQRAHLKLTSLYCGSRLLGFVLWSTEMEIHLSYHSIKLLAFNLCCQTPPQRSGMYPKPVYHFHPLLPGIVYEACLIHAFVFEYQSKM